MASGTLTSSGGRVIMGTLYSTTSSPRHSSESTTDRGPEKGLLRGVSTAFDVPMAVRTEPSAVPRPQFTTGLEFWQIKQSNIASAQKRETLLHTDSLMNDQTNGFEPTKILIYKYR